jgi:cell division protein FtsI/penicillin-binding protein 2
MRVPGSSSGETSPAAAMNRPELVREAQARDDAEAAQAVDWRRTLRRRLLPAIVVLGVWTLTIEARLVQLQVFQRAELEQRAERQQSRVVQLPGKRGEIVDRHGHVLAVSVDGHAVYAEPPVVERPEDTARQVCAAIEDCGADRLADLVERLQQRKRAFVFLWRRASPADASRIRALGLPGIGVLKEQRRYYPNRELGAHVLGYVGVDHKGLAGIEQTYDARIAGQPGKTLLQTDAKAQAFGRLERPPTAGSTLELTIDRTLQHIAERELEAGVAEFGAAGGTAIVMEPSTGDVLALANWPTFNPNAFQLADREHRKNRAVQDVYEPGSTFKVVTASAALEEGLLRPEDPIDVSAGYIRFGARQIDDVHRYGVLSFEDVLVKSSNVGAIKVGLRLGAARLVDYVRRFGFGQAVAPDLPGESRGIVWKADDLTDSALASVSMGYQVSVTPIQMAAAVNSIATGGALMAPRVVRAFLDGPRRIERPPHEVRRTVSPRTAATLTAIMEDVVARGTAEAAQIPGYTVAGKTGTAAKIEGGRYSRSRYNSSFVGFVPSRQPALTILVVIDSPQGRGYYGGAVAAPVFRRIAEASLRYLGIPPNVDPAGRVVVARRDETDEAAVAPTPASARFLAPLPAPAAPGAMPDLRGLSARDAVVAAARAGLTAILAGDGQVVDQDIEPGTAIVPGGVCRLRLSRLPLFASAGTHP